jgi:hypothetical protein
MKIRVTDPSLVDDLLAYLRGREYLAERDGEDTVEASPRPRSLRSDVARRELDEELREWARGHPRGGAELVD